MLPSFISNYTDSNSKHSKNQIEIERDEELLITDEMLSGGRALHQIQPGDLDWEMNCQNAVLKTNSTGTVVPIENNKFKTLNITMRIFD